MDPFWADFLRGMLKPVAATAVVLMAVLLSFFQNLGLEREMLYSIARAFLQLSVIGFVLQFIFTQKNSIWIVVAYLFMVSSSSSLVSLDGWGNGLLGYLFWCVLVSESDPISDTTP